MADITEELDKIGAETADALERFMDDREMYLKYVTSFPDEGTMQKLVAAVEAKDYIQAEKSVHALKGIVINLGFLPLADVAMDMLEELRDGSIDEALKSYENVKKQYKIFCDTIRACCENS